jgi:hypothetical protein
MHRLFAAVAVAMQQVFTYNEQHVNQIELSFDGQISNWSVVNLATKEALPADIELVYLDTNTPLMRKLGQEQLNRELLLRSAPSFLRPAVWTLFIDELSTRYYDVVQRAASRLAATAAASCQ